MNAPVIAPVESQDVCRNVSRKPIRGSTLLMAGRGVLLLGNLLIQVMIVRYLSKANYGAWAYALSVVTFLQGVAALGLDKAITRFVSIYHEKKEYEKLFGTILLSLVIVALASAVMIGALYAWPGLIAQLIRDQPQPIALLLVLIFLVPVDTLDNLLVGLFASFGKSRAIFLRRFVLGPALRLLAVLVLVASGSGVNFLAFGYVAASALGVLINGWMTLRLFRKQGLLEHFHLSGISVPVREILSFTLPLFSTELLTVFLQTFGILILGYFHSLDEVALFRVAVPMAAVNLTVMRSFAYLYTPAASRLFAKNDYEGINDLYWSTAIWMAVLTFPVFAFTFSAAPALVSLLYGKQYEQAGLYLALMSLGQYTNVALGFNGLTLKILNKVRYMVVINLLAGLANILACLLLIPPFGALGAAIATASALIAHNILKQWGLRLVTRVSVFESRFASSYGCIVASAAGLLVLQLLLPQRTLLLLGLAFLVSLVVLVHSKKELKIRETFPELLRVPGMRTILT